MAEQENPFGPRFSKVAIDAFRDTREYKDWSRNFENLKRAIARKVSPRDMQPLLKAGAKEDKLLTLLAFVVNDSKGVSSSLMKKRRILAALANELISVTQRATWIVKDPSFDGRFWLAVEGCLSWDFVPQAGVIETNVLKSMRALALLIRQRGEALGKQSRLLKRHVRTRGALSLIAYVRAVTKESFDTEIAYLLTAAHRATNQNKAFTADQIKKVRQRHLPTVPNRNQKYLQSSSLVGRLGIGAINNGKSEPKRLTLGQRIAGLR
jgi:hypothetical protein